MEEPVIEKEPPISDDIELAKDKEVKKSQKRGKDEKNSRKKDDKSVEQVLKALNTLETPEEKLAAMCKKYTEVLDEGKKHQHATKVAEKKIVTLQREKEQLQAEQSKAVLTRSRLESLCRELQRQNKATKEESLLRIREEEERRKEVSAKFHATLADITSLMQQNTESNSKLRDENLDMQNKFKSVCEQYELREQQVDKISKQMKLESQLADARLRKAKMEMLAEKEILERDKQQLMAEIALCQAKLLDHEKTEEALRAQISVYFEKYDEFQNVLTKSNQVYAGFKGEMEKMSKKITRLEKETSSWRQKWEGSHKALLQLAAEKQAKDAEVQLQARQLAQLQKLCRSLQTERTAFLQQLKSLGVAPVIEDAASEPEPPVQKKNSDVPIADKSTNAVGPADTTATTSSDIAVSSPQMKSTPVEALPKEEVLKETNIKPVEVPSTIAPSSEALSSTSSDQIVSSPQIQSNSELVNSVENHLNKETLNGTVPSQTPPAIIPSVTPTNAQVSTITSPQTKANETASSVTANDAPKPISAESPVKSESLETAQSILLETAICNEPNIVSKDNSLKAQDELEKVNETAASPLMSAPQVPESATVTDQSSPPPVSLPIAVEATSAPIAKAVKSPNAGQAAPVSKVVPNAIEVRTSLEPAVVTPTTEVKPAPSIPVQTSPAEEKVTTSPNPVLPSATGQSGVLTSSSSPSTEKKNQTSNGFAPGKGSSTPGSEQKKGKEGGRRRKK